MKKLIVRFLQAGDLLVALFVYPAAWLLKIVRKAGVQKLPHCKNALLRVGVFPICDHYYEPQFDHRSGESKFSENRILPGIDWNTNAQLDLLSKLSFAQELEGTPLHKTSKSDFYLNNQFFVAGDAEYWYQLIRLLKPSRIFEVGSGNSTLMATRAIRKNHEAAPEYRCKHVCIEPYGAPWLEQLDVSVLRKKVEDVEVAFFSELGVNDILFIDSSHMIRPRGDVLFEYLELLPTLKRGVIVHVHDIFSPNNYPRRWIEDEIKLWNEQYLLEAFLSDSSSWKILGALNYLHHNYYGKLKSIAPFLSADAEPGSFYIQKVV